MPLPSVLAHPPWKKTVPAAPVSTAKIESKSSGATLVWQEGERESFRGKPPPKTSPSHEPRRKLASVLEAVAELPAFFDVAKLPRPKLSDGTPLPDDAVRVLGEMLRFSPLGNPYLGIAQVRAACDETSAHDDVDAPVPDVGLDGDGSATFELRASSI